MWLHNTNQKGKTITLRSGGTVTADGEGFVQLKDGDDGDAQGLLDTGFTRSGGPNPSAGVLQPVAPVAEVTQPVSGATQMGAAQNRAAAQRRAVEKREFDDRDPDDREAAKRDPQKRYSQKR